MGRPREREKYSYEKRVEWVFSPEVQNLITNPTVKNVLAITALKYANSKTGLFWPAQATIAKRLGCSRETVCRALKQLVQKGLISPVASNRDTNTYRVSIQSESEKEPEKLPDIESEKTHLLNEKMATAKKNLQNKPYWNGENYA